MEEILLIDKPVGISSFDVIRQLRRIYRDNCLTVPKMGHAGTLDPLASGLMVIGVGRGTKRLAELTKLDKEYVAEIFLGRSTTTTDREGEMVAEKAVVEIFSPEKISTTLATMHGELNLPVSGFSAIKVDGVPMYKRARVAIKAGESVPTVSDRAMHVYSSELLHSTPLTEDDKQFQIITASFHVGSGTYIRSLAEELGRRLGDYPAHLHSLRRTKVGNLEITEAVQLDKYSPQNSSQG